MGDSGIDFLDSEPGNSMNPPDEEFRSHSLTFSWCRQNIHNYVQKKYKKYDDISIDNVIRWGFNTKKLMFDILNKLSSLASDLNDLVDVEWLPKNKGPYVNFSKLEDICMK